MTSDTTTCAVCVVSGQPIIVAGIHALLAEATDAGCAYLSTAHPADADVVIYDVFNLAIAAHPANEEELRELVAGHPGRVLALSRLLQPGLTARALAIGAAAPISVSADGTELVALVEAAVNGDLASDPQLVTSYDADLSTLLDSDVELTPRQKTVISRIAAGYSNEEIAAELYISPNTLKSAIRGVYSRIGVTSRASAVAWALSHGYQGPQARGRSR
ncbi:response regulator transcription factor [Nocardioides sp.]|uniref:helix-turn-helix transcriptional regulator n=1 Tax=Nocardioides sp. TaxID=35761 RepID=UPI002ED796C5